MRITIRLDDDLMRAVKRHALELGTTVTAVITEALREQLQRHGDRTSTPLEPLALATTAEGGLPPGVDLDDSAVLISSPRASGSLPGGNPSLLQAHVPLDKISG
ncbi:MAG: CopG family transcriptional regulator [Gemmatimonadales bacterium]|nr:CopG family transcriptional regulator [Gemmatimonadales bacterium]MYG49934.1 CopG family transcriptional regulator [Gemmatimonadales bacterium]MYK01614.1 CopG family transcriptional regulator [Candidatus Palauibacter ramosifaciens]